MPSLPEERFHAFLLGAAVGVLVGGLVVAVAAGWLVPADRTTSPTASMTTATGCHEDPSEDGWVGHVPVEDRAIVVFNYTLLHDAADVEVQGDLQNPAEGEYVYAITTAPATDSPKGSPPEECQPRTLIEVGVSLPREFGTLSITVDGRTLATVESGPGASPAFRPIDGSST